MHFCRISPDNMIMMMESQEATTLENKITRLFHFFSLSRQFINFKHFFALSFSFQLPRRTHHSLATDRYYIIFTAATAAAAHGAKHSFAAAAAPFWRFLSSSKKNTTHDPSASHKLNCSLSLIAHIPRRYSLLLLYINCLALPSRDLRG